MKLRWALAMVLLVSCWELKGSQNAADGAGGFVRKDCTLRR
jgi:hypothetical protein